MTDPAPAAPSLSPARRAELDPLIAIHDYVYSRSKVAPDAVSPELAASLPPVAST